jgi:hypothetical protein
MFGVLSVVSASVGIEQYRTLASQTARALTQIRDEYGFLVERCLVGNAEYWAWSERKQREDTSSASLPWLAFVRKHGLTHFGETAMLQLQKLTRGGIPDSLRAELWQVSSREALLERPYYYRHIGKVRRTPCMCVCVVCVLVVVAVVFYRAYLRVLGLKKMPPQHTHTHTHTHTCTHAR